MSDLNELHKYGGISNKAMAKASGNKGYLGVLNKTKHQKSKMAKFESRKKDEGQAHGRGIREMSTDQLNERDVQDSGGKYGTPSKGGRAGPERTPAHTNEINEATDQKPKFPKGGSKVSGKEAKRKVGVSGPPGKSAPSQYGGPSSRKYG